MGGNIHPQDGEQNINSR